MRVTHAAQRTGAQASLHTHPAQTSERAAAAQAGLQGCTRSRYGDLIVGDIIIGVRGREVRNTGDLFDILDDCKPGDRIRVDVYRPTSRARGSVEVTLGKRTLENQDG